ncbi:disulfide bond corrector protein DsbC [Terriglobus roseus DSM 18391]|uniref:Disulfide bond corrector protein DsbC n=1 Tax=Terriglobus roseus (strain DSM 18391 / NRRL B-41598 / KBS 63) TaxID=926566 RepID=I3ZCV9_TERRK|nr:protein-disulfide reductase DsbD N-terminal domain-containing protein [Terriglobus roseus]AFL87077.1 disulfide bond corrector protein DsbC [Terriglobus roseus DSM 18391]
MTLHGVRRSTVAALLLFAGAAGAQSINAGVASAVKKGHVDFLADAQAVPANQAATVKLHFRVEPGFHINSHTPKSDVLIPTKLTVAMVGDDPEVTGVDFPAGEPFAFAFEPKQKLDVYQGDVVLTAHLKAKPGLHSLKAELYYQACDQAACYPPKKLAVEQPYTAK